LSTHPSAKVERDVPRTALLLPAISLCRRELVRFLRQRNRIIGSLATPLMFWIVLGAGMGSSFQAPGIPGGDSYLRYFFPGTIVMILLFTSIFSTISIIEDRREGFLQSVLVAPVSRMSIVLGKLLGGTILATGQGLLFLLLAPTVGIHLSLVAFGLAFAFIFIVSFALTGLGFCIAWRMSSTQGFHAIMNLFLMPLLFLSGALFPMTTRMWWGVRWLMRADPITYGLAGLRESMYFPQPAASLPGLAVCFLVSIAFAAAMFLLSSAIVGGRVEADLQ